MFLGQDPVKPVKKSKIFGWKSKFNNRQIFKITPILYYNVLSYVTWALVKAKVITTVSWKNLFLKVSSTMLMEHFLCDGEGGKHNVCKITIYKIVAIK